jgi:hypothetical protein
MCAIVTFRTSSRPRTASSIPTLMNAEMLKELAATCWKQLEDFSACVDPKDADPRQTRFAMCSQVLKCLNAVESPDCNALKVWMSLREIAMPPGDSDMLAEAARDSASKGSPYGQFVLGFMHGFLGTFFWRTCEWGKRDKEEAIRLMELAKTCGVKASKRQSVKRS